MSYKYSYFPFSKQELLLKSALLDRDEASSAWDEYGAFIDRDTIDPASQRLLPLVYYNLKDFPDACIGWSRVQRTEML